MKRIDIPALAFIEHQVMHSPSSIEAFKAVMPAIEQQYGVPSGSLGSGVYYQTRILALLYLLIVFPREAWALDESDPIYQRIEELTDYDAWGVVPKQSGEKPFSFEFIRRIRNAVAHANVEFFENEVRLWDRNGFRATCSFEAISQWLSEVGALLANLRNIRTDTKH